MEILLIVIVAVIVSIVSAANKKKTNQSSENAPARPVMSDIQKAFMMSSGMGAPQHRAPETRQTASNPMAARKTEVVAERLNTRTVEAMPPAATMAQNKYSNIDLNSFGTQNADIADAPIKTATRQRTPLRLFENKNDFVRAVIYSEILTRKTR